MAIESVRLDAPLRESRRGVIAQRPPMVARIARSIRRLLLAVAFVSFACAAATGRTEAQRPTFAPAKPHAFARQTDAGNQFLQVAAVSTNTLGATPIQGIETKVAHSATIIAPANRAASYSYSVGAFTPVAGGARHWLQMGYLVLGSDGGGLARWFTQVLRCPASGGSCATVSWKMSRAGEANPPPACAACSGDAGHGGYPFAVTSDAGGTWTFWFDGIRKDRVSLGSAFNAIDAAQGVYFVGEVTAPDVSVAGTTMEPRGTSRTLRLWSSQTGWVEPSAASASSHSNATAVSVCPPNDIRFVGRARDTYIGTDFNRVEAGAFRTPAESCTGNGSALW